MRVEKQITIDAPCEEVWEVIGDPSNWPRLMHGITRFDQKGEQEPGVGARYSMRMRVGSADVGGLIEIVEYDENRDMAWTSITGIDQRGRWRVREAPGGATTVTLRLSYDAPGGILATIADRLSAPMVARSPGAEPREPEARTGRRRWLDRGGNGTRRPRWRTTSAARGS